MAATPLVYSRFKAPDAPGGTVDVYEAGSLQNRKTTYSNPGLTTPNANPVVLDSLGEADIFYTGVARLVIKKSNGSQISDKDNITSVAETSTEWINGLTATYVSSNSFTLSGNQTTEYHRDRRIKVTGNSTWYGTITASTYSAPNTTVTFRVDKAQSIDSSVASANTGFASATNPSFPDFLTSKYFGEGFVPSNAADADHDLQFTDGVVRNSTNSQYCRPTWTTIIKQIDAIFAEGTNAGGMATGAVASQTVYFCNLIMKTADNTVFDICYDVSAVGANTPSGWSFQRCVFALITDASANILPFQAFEIGGGSVEIIYDGLQAEFSTANPGISRVNHTTLFVPQTPGHDVTGYFNFSLIDVTPAADTYMLINTQFETDVAASATMHHLMLENSGATIPATNSIAMNLRVYAVSGRTISYRLDASTADTTVKCFARGYRIDRAGS